MKTLLSVCVVGLMFTGCAAPLVKPSELTAGARSVAFVQNGRHPAKLSIGAVDGKTSWSNYSILGTRMNEADKNGPAGSLTVTGKAGPDLAVGAGLEIVSHIGKAIADGAMKDDPRFYDRLFERMVGARELGADVGRNVLPVLARRWGVAYTPAQLTVLPQAVALEDEDGRYLAVDPGNDLVFVFTLSELMLSEKPSMRGLKAVVSFGMYDKEVMPHFLGQFAVYRRQPAGHLQRVWRGACNNGFADATAEEWTALRDDPARGGALLDKTVTRIAPECERGLKLTLAGG